MSDYRVKITHEDGSIDIYTSVIKMRIDKDVEVLFKDDGEIARNIHSFDAIKEIIVKQN